MSREGARRGAAVSAKAAPGAAPSGRVDTRQAALDGLAGSLRERMLAQPPEPGAHDDAQERIRAFVDREAAVLDAASRDALVARIAERSFGLGPLEPLLADPEVDEILVCGTAPAWVERRGRLEATERAVRRATASCATRSSASSRRSAAASTRPSRSSTPASPTGL